MQFSVKHSEKDMHKEVKKIALILRCFIKNIDSQIFEFDVNHFWYNSCTIPGSNVKNFKCVPIKNMIIMRTMFCYVRMSIVRKFKIP